MAYFAGTCRENGVVVVVVVFGLQVPIMASTMCPGIFGSKISEKFWHVNNATHVVNASNKEIEESNSSE